MGAFIDLTGKIFGRLTVLNREGSDKDNRPLWKCLCECGEITIKKGNLLRRGETKSCRCFLIEKNKERAISNKRKVPNTLLSVYTNMKRRCYNSKDISYPRYGGRGITVCERWLNSYENFYNDMINGYNCIYQIDRIDNNGNYCKENCRWVTQEQNIQNSTSAKVNENIVKAIRNSNKKTKELQKEFNLSRSAVKSIRYNRSWKNIN